MCQPPRGHCAACSFSSIPGGQRSGHSHLCARGRVGRTDFAAKCVARSGGGEKPGRAGGPPRRPTPTTPPPHASDHPDSPATDHRPPATDHRPPTTSSRHLARIPARSCRAIVRPRTIGGGTTCGSTRVRRGESVPTGAVALTRREPVSSPRRPIDERTIQLLARARANRYVAPLLVAGACALAIPGLAFAAGSGGAGTGPGSGSGGSGSTPAPPPVSIGNAPVTATSDGITITTEESAFLRPGLSVSGSRPGIRCR